MMYPASLLLILPPEVHHVAVLDTAMWPTNILHEYYYN